MRRQKPLAFLQKISSSVLKAALFMSFGDSVVGGNVFFSGKEQNAGIPAEVCRGFVTPPEGKQAVYNHIYPYAKLPRPQRYVEAL